MGVPGILLVCLSVLLPGSCWLMHQVQGQVTVTVLDVGQGDGICIRIFVSHYKYFLILHSHSSFQNSADLCTIFICNQSFLFRVYFSNTLYRRFSFWAIVLIVQICTLY